MIEDLGIFSDFEHTAWDRIPGYMREPIARYMMHGVVPGKFLSAVLCNDFFGAVRHADDTNRDRLLDYARFFYNHCPAISYGSPELMRLWVEKGGLNGRN